MGGHCAVRYRGDHLTQRLDLCLGIQQQGGIYQLALGLGQQIVLCADRLDGFFLLPPDAAQLLLQLLESFLNLRFKLVDLSKDLAGGGILDRLIFGLFIFIDLLGFSKYSLNIISIEISGEMISKLILAVVVVIFNYFCSKLIIFKKKMIMDL